MTVVLTEAGAQYRDPDDGDRAFWVSVLEDIRDHPDLLPYLQQEDPETYRWLVDGVTTLAIEAKTDEWRDPDPEIGARPEQLIPGTPGSFSDRTDWALYLLCGGRGSGKSRTGAEGTSEMLLGREWTEAPRWALVGQTLDSVRIDMVENTLLEVLPPSTVHNWNRNSCELWVWVPAARSPVHASWDRPKHLAYLKGYSSEAPRKLRGPNFHGGWFDELATWKDANLSPQANGSTYSTAMMAMRAHDNHTWTPRVIGTTTPKAVRLLRNPDPDDPNNPGPGIYDDPGTVVASMSTLANTRHLSQHYVDRVIRPLKGTRLWSQEVEGELITATLGALWTLELIDGMRSPQFSTVTNRQILQPETVISLLGLKRIVIGVDPSIGGGTGDECGIVLAGIDQDGAAWILEDLSARVPAAKWCRIIQKAYDRWGADAVVVETNQGGELVEETLGRYAPNLPVQSVWAKKGKALRAEPVALLSDGGRVRMAGKFPTLSGQMATWKEGMDSPDRLDAMVYSILYLIPPREGLDSLVTIHRGKTRQRA